MCKYSIYADLDNVLTIYRQECVCLCMCVYCLALSTGRPGNSSEYPHPSLSLAFLPLQAQNVLGTVCLPWAPCPFQSAQPKTSGVTYPAPNIRRYVSSILSWVVSASAVTVRPGFLSHTADRSLREGSMSQHSIRRCHSYVSVINPHFLSKQGRLI